MHSASLGNNGSVRLDYISIHYSSLSAMFAPISTNQELLKNYV